MGLIILEPADGATVSERVIFVRGLAQPGSVVTRNIPLWLDEHATADAAGRWAFPVSLNVGENVMNFRVGDDMSTNRTLTVTYRPG